MADEFLTLARDLLKADPHDCDHRSVFGCPQCLEDKERLMAAESLAEHLRARLAGVEWRGGDLAVRAQIRDECVAWLRKRQLEEEPSPSEHAH